MTDSKVPFWARKPTHKGVVVATEKGWEVESTGELLVRVQGLSTRLTDLYKTAPTGEIKDTVPAPEEKKEEEFVEQPNNTVKAEVPKEEVVNPVPKKRGRPAKAKS